MENDEVSICPLCRQEKMKIFAVGECSHPVCYLCSTKMRILCEQTYCAICRQELPQVYFVSKIAETQSPIDPSRFIPIDETGDCGIYYPIKAEWIRRETEKLLRNFCPSCHVEYETFDILRDHVRRAHRYFYCDLCVEHVNLFPYERKCYTRHDLVQHIRCGDRDDKSFKGHPLCKFCDDHFLDDDQLYKHMRKEHYYCHLCTNDNIYYSDFDLLRDHYRSNHYLCEIDQCKDVQFTNVFATDFEFRAHQSAHHGKTRAQARQLGTIPVEFETRGMRDRRQHDPAHRGIFKSGKFNTQENNNSSENERDAAPQEPAVAVAAAVPTIEEFPTLNERSSNTLPQQRGAWSNDARGINSADEFPALVSATSNVVHTNAKQPKGIWREQQQQQQPNVASNTSSTTPKKGSQSVQPVSNGSAPVNMKEDFPALKGAVNSRIPAPVSMLSAWSTARKSAKNATANTTGHQRQMRMNTNRIVHDEEDEEYIRRPMSSLMTSSTTMASSNISMISSSDVSSGHTNDKQNKNKNQSLPKAQDFPALSSTNATSNSTPSGVWTAVGNTSSGKSSATQQKKKSNTTSKKKFMEEVHAMAPAPSLSSMEDFPTVGLSELGRRLIVEDNVPTPTAQVKKEEKPALPPQPIVKEEKKQENKPSAQSNKKDKKVVKKNETVPQEVSSKKEETPVIETAKQASTQAPAPVESVLQPTASPPAPPPPASTIQPPPGFSAATSLPPPPGFNPMSASQPAPPSYIHSSTYAKQKDEFRAKLFTLFDGDMDLFVQYDQFCEAFSENKIGSNDFIKFTGELFKDKLDEYLPELIVIIPNIEQQNELYSIWERDIHSTATTQNKANWTTKKNTAAEDNPLHKCHLCQQVLFENDIDEHNSHHTSFNTQFPSLPPAAVSFGRGSGKKKK